MAYQVLARKWRPQDFSSLVGQEHIVTALRNALQEGRIAQAYLFSGIRGVGKTTAARVLAKALNCERGPAADPCNDCARCREIGAGASLDMLEVDAATYSKVEQIRELTETLRYAPTGGRYKVVVLDEVHRLSRRAFDALLKIVEEPPPAPGLHLRHHRDRRGAGDHPVALPGVPVPPGALADLGRPPAPHLRARRTSRPRTTPCG